MAHAPKRTSPFKSLGASVLSTASSPGVRISGSNAGHTMFRGSVKSTGYPFHSPVTPSLPLPCVTVCHHISTGLYLIADSGVYSCCSGKSGLIMALCPVPSDDVLCLCCVLTRLYDLTRAGNSFHCAVLSVQQRST